MTLDHFFRRMVGTVLTLVTVLWVASPAVPVQADHWPAEEPLPAKVTRRAWAAMADAQHTALIVTMAGFPDLSPARALLTKEAKTRFVVEALLRYVERAQAGLRRELDAQGVRYHVLWISNSLYIPSADRSLARRLAARPDVTSVDLDVQMRGVYVDRLGAPGWASRRLVKPKSIFHAPFAIEWGVTRVRAPEVWALGFTGQGIVVADLDTGVQWNHPALKNQYRGWDGSSAAHDYNWYDAAYDLMGDTRSPVPHDDNGHGTHTTGTIIGDDGLGNQIGVAPGARWIACRNMRFGIGSVARYTACFQFALAPTDVNGNNPDPSKAADITSNSWGCDPGYGEIGCEVPSALVTVTQVLRDAGIMTVAAAGNSGSACGSVIHAPATLDQAFTVGATNGSNVIAGFSSRGPSLLTGRLKPDVVAPGVSVRSAYPTNQYAFLSGTSMATPHAAGVVALLWSAAPWLRGQITATEAILRSTAQPLTTAETCGGVLPGAVPNNTYGYGLINARAALSEAHRLALSAAADTQPLHPLGSPVTYTLILTNNTSVTHTNVTVTAAVPLSTTLLGTAPPALTHNGIATWTIAALPPFAVLTVTLVISAPPGLHTVYNYAASAPALLGAYTGQPAVTLVYAHQHWMIPVYR
ncbi:MAG: S8 family serine peptidase [Anaerolineae bacterium]|nr:S8 family serine peptidase [Thermoflexales bacterium]MDW8407102.1 S8 family serine peptidase [Anaerolineae bacterium]